MIAALLGGATVATVYALWLPARGGDTAYYELSRDGVIGVFIAASTASAGAALIALRYRTSAAALSAITATVLGFALLALASIGIFILPVGIVMLVVTARAMRGLAVTRVAASAASGVALAGGLLVLLLAGLRGPIVTCFPGGASSSPTYWWGGSPGSGTGSTSGGPGNATTRGYVTRGNTTFHFVCDGGRLVEVRQEPTPP